MVVTLGNALQRAPNQALLKENTVTRVVRRSSYGKSLH